MSSSINEMRVREMERMLKNAMSLDDTFNFRCRECGKCCRNREDILLSPYDLNRAAKYLGIEMGAFLKEYCNWYVGESSRVPVVALNMQGPERICPLLEQGKCKIHAAKPTVCALFPLGRAGFGQDHTIKYILQDVKCGARDEEHTVREWLAGYGLEQSEEWFAEWQKAISPMIERKARLDWKMPPQSLEMLEFSMFGLMYVEYEMNRDFMEQFRKNMAQLFAILRLAEQC